MKLEDEEIVKRYLYEATRYMEYDKMEMAKDDILHLLEENIQGQERTRENLERALRKMGNPYTLGKHYESQGNVLITGRYYRLYMRMLKVATVGMVVGQGISFMIEKTTTRVGLTFTLESLLYNLLLTFFVTTFAFTMAEKIKAKKILKSILEPWTPDSLKTEIPFDKLNPRILLYIGLYTTCLGKILTDYYEYHRIFNPGILHLLPSLLFILFIFRDALRMSHTRRRKAFFHIITWINGLGLILTIRLLFLLKGQVGFYATLAILILLFVDMGKNRKDQWDQKS